MPRPAFPRGCTSCWTTGPGARHRGVWLRRRSGSRPERLDRSADLDFANSVIGRKLARLYAPEHGGAEAAATCPYKGLACLRGGRCPILLRPRAARGRARRPDGRRRACSRSSAPRAAGSRPCSQRACFLRSTPVCCRGATGGPPLCSVRASIRCTGARLCARRSGTERPPRARHRPVRGAVHGLRRRRGARSLRRSAHRARRRPRAYGRRHRAARRLLRTLCDLPGARATGRRESGARRADDGRRGATGRRAARQARRRARRRRPRRHAGRRGGGGARRRCRCSSTSLVELWFDQADGRLRLESHKRLGGMRGAVARLAESSVRESR